MLNDLCAYRKRNADDIQLDIKNELRPVTNDISLVRKNGKIIKYTGRCCSTSER